MEPGQSTKDLTALFRKAGLHRVGGYREFPRKRRDEIAGDEAVSVATLPAGDDFTTAFPTIAVPPTACIERAPSSLDRVWDEGPHSIDVGTRAAAASIAWFSLAGGVGKTTLASTLAQVLCGRNRQVVLANLGASYGMRYLYGPHAQSIGPFTILHGPHGERRLPLTLLEAGEASKGHDQEQALKLVQATRNGSDAVVLDCPTSGSKSAANILGMADRILIPVLPDMHSALTLQSIDGILRDHFGARGKIHYILNRFDVTRRAHREMRERLQKILGNALAPFSIREDSRIQDAMQAGLTVVDYAPHAEVIGDLKTCGDWIEEMLPSAIAVKGMTA